MRATRVRVAAIARGQNARARVDVRRIAETATARVGAGGRASLTLPISIELV